LRAQRNYAGHRLAPWLGHVMVSRQETARPLLTPGEVMQLPQDEAIVLVSGLAPIRAKKLRHYQDENFTSRLQPPPRRDRRARADRPRPRPDNWSGQVRNFDVRLGTLPFKHLMHAGDDDGGLKLQLTLFDESAPDVADQRVRETPILDDETDTMADGQQMQRAALATVRRAHGVTRDDDDVLPGF
jgi:type IV secretion system protein VirD4